MRLIKTLDEIKGIRKANQIIAKIYTDIIPPYLKPGITTRELTELLMNISEAVEQGLLVIGVEGIYGPFPAATCISVNEVVVHGIPSKKQILKEGDILTIDTVTVLDGYFGDSAITYAVGEIDENF